MTLLQRWFEESVQARSFDIMEINFDWLCASLGTSPSHSLWFPRGLPFVLEERYPNPTGVNRTHHNSWSPSLCGMSSSSHLRLTDYCHHTLLTCKESTVSAIANPLVHPCCLHACSYWIMQIYHWAQTPEWDHLHSKAVRGYRGAVERGHWEDHLPPPGSCTGIWPPVSQSWIREERRGEKRRGEDMSGEDRKNSFATVSNCIFILAVKLFNRPDFIFFWGAVSNSFTALWGTTTESHKKSDHGYVGPICKHVGGVHFWSLKYMAAMFFVPDLSLYVYM